MNRRRYLALTGSTLSVGIAGCASDDDGDSTETTASEPTDTETPNSTTTVDTTPTETEPAPAEFAVLRIEHPDEVDVGEKHTISVTVENVGGKAGTYSEVLEVSTAETSSWDTIGTITLEDIPPGERETWTSGPTTFNTPGTVQFRLGPEQWEYDVVLTTPDVQSFSGSGLQIRQDISIQGGLTVVEATHDGESNFQVSLADNSEFGNLFINVVGPFDGAQAELLERGEYILDVNADGNWTVDIRQPRGSGGSTLPESFQGTGPSVVGPVSFEGVGIASGTHDGESNFQVTIYPMQGTVGSELVFNESGTFAGERTYSFDELGWVEVDADGSWTLSLE